MGYTLAVPLKSTKARDECLAFLKANFRPWTQVKPSFPEGVQMLEDLDQWVDGRVESEDPLVVEKVADAFKEAGIAHTIEYGPIVLTGFRKRIADEEEAIFLTAEKVVQEELQRLEVQVRSRSV